MAKLKAPLLSLGASGQLGKSLVYFGWKGLDLVREYVIPANPKTTLQVAQRAIIKAVVAKLHLCQGLAAHPFCENDKIAYARLANTRKTVRTWFNEVCRMWLICKAAGGDPLIYYANGLITTTHDAFRPRAFLYEETGSQLAAAKCYLGTTPTALINVKTADVTLGEQVNVALAQQYTNLVKGVRYYWQFRPDVDDPSEECWGPIDSFVAT